MNPYSCVTNLTNSIKSVTPHLQMLFRKIGLVHEKMQEKVLRNILQSDISRGPKINASPYELYIHVFIIMSN